MNARRVRFSLAVALVAGMAAGASAQQQPAVPTVEETVQVVATRLPEAPHEVPASIEVFTGDDLRALGASSLKDALSLATGVAIAPGGDGGPAGAVPEFWGLREFDAFLLVVDDVPWGGAFNPALTALSMRDVERVEVLRGPAPVTFGATSFVGVIHVVHRAAATDRSYATVSGGSYGSGGGAIDFAIPSAGAWRSRLSVDGERQGFKDDRTSFSRGHALWRTTRAANDRRLWFLADVNVLRQDPASPHPRQGTALSARVPLDANHNPDGAFLNENRINVG
ncbi:MAG: TonB-dependent receptor plug domain-containing protein, partial [Vicinamibacterales bacterium]